MTSVTDQMTTAVRHRSLCALLLALTLFAVACAGTTDTVSTEAADAAADESAEAAPDTDAHDAMADEATDDSVADEPADDAMSDEDSASDDETSAPVGGPPPSLPPEEAAAAAEQNIPDLQPADDVRDIEVVSVYNGSITSLRDVVTGDRPVLLWFWAPH